MTPPLSSSAQRTSLRAAVVQMASIFGNPMETARQAALRLREAAAQGARLVVFPEALIGGYPKGARFGAPIGMRTPEGREAFRRYFEGAVTREGPEVSLLAEAAAETGSFVVVGIVEREGGTLYCTALYIDGARGVVSYHRKLMPTAGERLIWGFGDGSTMQAVKAEFGTVGAVICWENYMPALRMHMYAQGVEFYCAPTADDRDTWMATMQHIALEGRCFVLSACQYMTRAQFPPEHESALGDDPATVMLRGGSVIVSPLGQILAGPDRSGETILYAELDKAEIARGKFDFDATGHYARPDIFQLSVDTRPKPAVRPV